MLGRAILWMWVLCSYIPAWSNLLSHDSFDYQIESSAADVTACVRAPALCLIITITFDTRSWWQTLVMVIVSDEGKCIRDDDLFYVFTFLTRLWAAEGAVGFKPRLKGWGNKIHSYLLHIYCIVLHLGLDQYGMFWDKHWF